MKIKPVLLFVIIFYFRQGKAQLIDPSTTHANSIQNKNIVVVKGAFITIKTRDGSTCRAYAAGPENAKAGVLIVHD